MNIEKEEHLRKIKENLEEIKRKMDLRYKNNDFDGVVTLSKTYLEGVMEEIFYLLCEKPMEVKNNDLRDKWNIIKKMVYLDPNKVTHDELKTICGSISSIISSVENLANFLGDRHFSIYKLDETKKYTAEFIMNLTLLMAEFLYKRLEFLYIEFPENIILSFYEKLIKILDSEKRNYTRKELISNDLIKKWFYIFDKEQFVIEHIKIKLIEDFKIDSFRDNDIFFSAMKILFEYLNKEDINKIWLKCKENNQTYPPYGHLFEFLYFVKNTKPEYINKEQEEFIKKFLDSYSEEDFKIIFNIWSI
ncbi:MAG: hypothetical protein KatS3mg095_0899 [Candidatus Parcubacteria bacterium]|nr:MAG: hypothetical protein KatS3mg095_0899 [Candidatus Parcubacteria bacterium]